MAHPGPLDLFDKSLRDIERAPDDKRAEWALLFAFGLLQMAGKEFEDCGDRTEDRTAHRTGERALPPAELPSRAHREHLPFEQGYIAGWQSVRGADDEPVLIPRSPVFVGPTMYTVGYSRGARDASC
jgi:hypothetical protein